MAVLEVISQRQIVCSLINKELKKGDTWYLIDSRWYNKWKKYVGYDSRDKSFVQDQTAHPGVIDNRSLSCSQNNVLKKDLIHQLDYQLVPVEVWKLFVSWYGLLGGNQVIARKVIDHGMFVKWCKVEVYLTDLKLALVEGQNEYNMYVVKSFSGSDTIHHVEHTMRQLFGIRKETPVLLWCKHMINNTYELLTNLDLTVGYVGFDQDRLMLIEKQNKAGSLSSAMERKRPTSVAPQTEELLDRKRMKRRNSMEEMITCAVCLSIMVNPQGLPCFHTFCKKCIHQLKKYIKGQQQGFLCPVCKAFSGLEDIKNNFMVNQLIEMHTSIKDDRDDCFCLKHPNCKVEALCKECRVEICSKCKFQDHDTHPSQSIQSAVQEHLPSISKKVHQLSSDIDEMKIQCTNLRKQKNILEVKKASLIFSVQGQKRAIENRLNEEYGKVMADIENVTSSTENNLTTRVSQLQKSIQNMEVIKAEMSSLIASNKDVRLLRNLEVKREMCDGILKKYENENIKTMIELPNVSFQKAKSSTSLLGKVIKKIDTKKSINN